jgi:hypothetical protein
VEGGVEDLRGEGGGDAAEKHLQNSVVRIRIIFGPDPDPDQNEFSAKIFAGIIFWLKYCTVYYTIYWYSTDTHLVNEKTFF